MTITAAENTATRRTRDTTPFAVGSAARQSAITRISNPNGIEAASSSRTCAADRSRSEEHTSELQSLAYLVCRLLLEKKKKNYDTIQSIHDANVIMC